MYTATVLLKRSEKAFWRMTPRKLSALAYVHIEVKGGGKDDAGNPKENQVIKEGPWKGAKLGYVDQL